MLERRGKSQESREALRSAVAFDPALAATHPFTSARLRDPLAPLAALAAETAGRTIHDRPSLDDLVASLAGRVRLTYQVAGPPDGRLHELALALDRGLRPVYPRWSRSGTPPHVGTLRLRRLLTDRAEEGPLPVEVSCSLDARAGSGEGGHRARLTVRLPPTPATTGENGPGGGGLRLSWGGRGPETGAVIHQRLLRAEERLASALDLSLTLPPGHVWVGAVVEEIAGGAWGGDLAAAPLRADGCRGADALRCRPLQ